MKQEIKQPVIIITGPTASGKTGFSYELASLLAAEGMQAEMINADIGQCYTPLSIGTAKPPWREHPVPAHLFDILDTARDCSVAQYRTLALAAIDEIQARGNVPIVVGGSMFYVQSLLFPPRAVPPRVDVDTEKASSPYSWADLNVIDPVRASQIHPNDTYRIQRALTLWHTTGTLPSQLLPSYDFDRPVLLVIISPDREALRKNIAQRGSEMLNAGWVEEADRMMDSEWEPFIRYKGLIGYDVLFDAIKASSPIDEHITQTIATQTWQYAKRQYTFQGGLARKLAALEIALCHVETITKPDAKALASCVNYFHLLEKKST